MIVKLGLPGQPPPLPFNPTHICGGSFITRILQDHPQPFPTFFNLYRLGFTPWRCQPTSPAFPVEGSANGVTPFLLAEFIQTEVFYFIPPHPR